MKRIFVAVLAVIASLLAACAPQVAPPTPTTVASATPRPTAAPTTSAPAQTSQDAAVSQLIAAARKEGTVTVYAYNYTGDIGTAISRGFQAAYGVKADIITGRGAEFFERMKTEARIGQRLGDVVEGGTIHLINMKNAGLLTASLDAPALKTPAIFNVDPLGLDKEGYILNEGYTMFTPYINTNMVKSGQEPKSWKDFLDPKWKGQILANDPQVSMTWYNALVPMVSAGVLSVDFIKQVGLTQAFHYATGDYEVAQRLSQGEYPIAMIIADVSAAPSVQSGAPIKAIPMADGIPVSTIVIGAIKDSPHTNAAKLFVNWILSQEGQTVFHKAQATAPIRTDVSDFRLPNASIPSSTKLIIMTKADGDEAAKEFTNKFYTELWKK